MLKIDGHDNAIIGPACIWTDHTRIDVLVYDAEIIRENLMKEGMDSEEAREFIEFNIEEYLESDYEPANEMPNTQRNDEIGSRT